VRNEAECQGYCKGGFDKHRSPKETKPNHV
jgi:hypothetical protein